MHVCNTGRQAMKRLTQHEWRIPAPGVASHDGLHRSCELGPPPGILGTWAVHQEALVG